MKKLLVLFFVMALFTVKRSFAQDVSSPTSPGTNSFNDISPGDPFYYSFEPSCGGYTASTALTSYPGKTLTYISVYVNLVGFNSADDFYSIQQIPSPGSWTASPSVYVPGFDWSKYSQVGIEWFAEYSDDTYDDVYDEWDF